MKFIFLLITLLFILDARDNPFTDVVSSESFPVSTNIPKKLNDLKQESFRLPNSARVVKRVIIEYQNLDGSIDRLATSLDKKVDWHMPLVLKHRKAPVQGSIYRDKIKLPFIKFSTKSNKMKLKTEDKLLRHFMLTRPHRIVLDFEGSIKILARSYKRFSKPFKKVRLGNHNGYYRVVVELDGQYEYQKQSYNSDIILTIR